MAFLILFVPIFALPMLPPSAKAWLARVTGQADFKTIGLIAAGLLAAADAVLLVVADRRFRRSRLMLD